MEQPDNDQVIELDDWDADDIPTVDLPHRDGGWTYEAIQEFREKRRRLNGGVRQTERLILPTENLPDAE